MRFDPSPPVQQQPTQPFVIPPPRWDEEARERAEAEPGPSAVERMMIDAEARGELEDRPIPGPDPVRAAAAADVP